MEKNNMKEKTRPITPQQIKALHATFHEKGFDDDARHEFIETFTCGRTNSTKELTKAEAFKILSSLNGENIKKNNHAAKEVIKSIYMLSFKISFLNKNYDNSKYKTQEDKMMNIAKINRFCIEKSKARKAIKEMSLEELKDVKKQLEAIARKEK